MSEAKLRELNNNQPDKLSARTNGVLQPQSVAKFQNIFGLRSFKKNTVVISDHYS